MDSRTAFKSLDSKTWIQAFDLITIIQELGFNNLDSKTWIQGFYLITIIQELGFKKMDSRNWNSRTLIQLLGFQEL